MKRFALASFTFAVLSLGYALYARVVVPHIEPTLHPLDARHLPPENADSQVTPSRSGGPQMAREIAQRAFGAQASETKAPFVWQFSSEQTITYFFTEDYREEGCEPECDLHAHEQPSATNNHVVLEPLSMVVQNTTADGQKTVSLTTLRCPRARLHFDELDMKRLQAGKPVGGRLEGTIEVRHVRAGDDEPWTVRTRDVRLLDAMAAAEAPPRLATDASVEFTHGEDHGSGEGLDIFLTAPAQELKTGGGLAVSGIASLRIRRHVRFIMRVDPEAASFSRVAGQPERSPLGSAGEAVPLEIRCSGPFQYSLETQAASFRDAVEVLHQVSPTETERLQCEQLELSFARRDAAEPDVRNAGGATAGLTFRKLRASGKPVLIHSPQNNVNVLASFISHDAERRETVLANDGAPVRIVDEAGEIDAGRLTIRLDEQGEVVSVLAEGPGWMKRRDEKADQHLHARWSRQLAIDRDQELYVLGLRGQAAMRSTGQGSLEAEQIDIWLRPKEDAGERSFSSRQRNEDDLQAGNIAGMEPVELHAEGDVQIDAPQLAGQFGRLELRFKDAGATVAAGGPSPGARPTSGALPDRTSGGRRQIGISQSAKLHINARSLHVELLRSEAETRISQAWAEGNIDARQQQTPQAEASGLVLRGQTMRLHGASGQEELRLTGSPAEVKSEEMVLSGKVIELHREANRLNVYGAGVLVLAVDRDFDGRELASPKELEIHWSGGLVFDGAVAVFRDSVEARLEDTRVLCHRMDVMLERPISFIDPPDDVRGTARIHRLVCHSDPTHPGSMVEMIKEVRREGKLAEYQHGVGPHIVFDSSSGDILVKGPGTFVSVAPGDDPGVGMGFARPRAAAQQAATADPGLKRLQIRYAEMMTGNLNQNRATFRDRVEVLYGPIGSADQGLDPHRLPNGGLWLRSDVLEVAREEAPPDRAPPRIEASRSESPVLLTATGNVEADVYEGGLHSAHAHRISYSEAWDRLIIEGRGSRLAKLWQQTAPGAKRAFSTGDRITFHPRSQELKVDGAAVIEGQP